MTDARESRALAIRTDLVQQLNESRALVLQVVAPLSEAELQATPATAKWSLLDMLCHLEAWESEWTAGLEEIAAGARPRVADFDLTALDDWNAAAVEARRGQGLAEALARWAATRTRLLAALEQVPLERWTEKASLAKHLARSCVLHPLKHLDVHIRPALERYQSLPSEEEVAPAAYREFLTRGYDEASEEAVARALGVSLSALRGRYPSKYDLWYRALCTASEGLLNALEAVGAGADGPLEHLRQVCVAYVAYGLENPAAYRFLYMPRSEAMRNPDEPAPGVISGRALMQRLVKRCMREGIFQEQPVELATQSLWCALHGVTEFRLNIRRIPWADGLHHHVIETYINGLRAVGSAAR